MTGVVQGTTSDAKPAGLPICGGLMLPQSLPRNLPVPRALPATTSEVVARKGPVWSHCSAAREAFSSQAFKG